MFPAAAREDAGGLPEPGAQALIRLKRVVLDEDLPRPLRRASGPEFSVVTVQEPGLAGWKNGDLIRRLADTVGVFVTSDKNLRYQQNLVGLKLATVELPTNRLKALEPLVARIVDAVRAAAPGSYAVV